MTSKKERKEHKEYNVILRHRKKYHKDWKANNYSARGNVRLLMRRKAFDLIIHLTSSPESRIIYGRQK